MARRCGSCYRNMSNTSPPRCGCVWRMPASTSCPRRATSRPDRCPGRSDLNGATLRLLLSEYVKYVAAEVRVRLADAGLDLMPEAADQPTGSLPGRPATAQAN